MHQTMWNPEELVERAKELKFEPRLTRTEFENVHTLIHAEQDILSIVEVESGRFAGQEITAPGLLVAADRYIIFYNTKPAGETILTIKLSSVVAVSMRSGWSGATVTISTTGEESMIRCKKSAAADLTTRLKTFLHSTRAEYAEAVSSEITSQQQEGTFIGTARNGINSYYLLGEIKQQQHPGNPNTGYLEAWIKCAATEGMLAQFREKEIEGRTKWLLHLEGYENYLYRLEKWQCDIAAGKIRKTRSIDYAEDGSALEIYGDENSSVEWKEPAPGSLGEDIFEFFANRFQPQ